MTGGTAIITVDLELKKVDVVGTTGVSKHEDGKVKVYVYRRGASNPKENEALLLYQIYRTKPEMLRDVHEDYSIAIVDEDAGKILLLGRFSLTSRGTLSSIIITRDTIVNVKSLSSLDCVVKSLRKKGLL